MTGADCNHPETVLLALDCGAGGRQFRRYCVRCWQASAAISHARAKAELRGAEPTIGDLEQLHAARMQFLRQQWNRNLPGFDPEGAV